MKAKFKILIIDDEWKSREDVYRSVLSEDSFDLIPVNNGSEWQTKIESEVVDGYILDIVLGKWKYISNGKPLEINEVLAKIGKLAPVMLVSSEYSKLVDPEENKLTAYVNNIIENGYNVPAFFTWQDFEKERKFKDDNTHIKYIKQSVTIHLSKLN
jgi:DNA-binding LytR/AlgR family response regulator